MTSIIIEPSNKADYKLFVGLAKRMKVKFQIKNSEITKNGMTSEAQQEANFLALAGSFDLPESSDELIKIMEESRISKEMDTSWAL